MRDGDDKNLPSTTCWTAGEPRGKIIWLEAVRARGTGSARINSLAWDTIATDDTKKFRRQECTDANQGSLSRADVCPSNSSSPSIRGTISAGAPWKGEKHLTSAFVSVSKASSFDSPRLFRIPSNTFVAKISQSEARVALIEWNERMLLWIRRKYKRLTKRL